MVAKSGHWIIMTTIGLLVVISGQSQHTWLEETRG